MADNMVSVGICRGLRLQLLQGLGLHETQVYLDAENFTYEPGTKLDGRRVLNDEWEKYYFRALEQSKVMLIFLTEGYFESVYILQAGGRVGVAGQAKGGRLARGGALAGGEGRFGQVQAAGRYRASCARDGDEEGVVEAVQSALADAGVSV